MLGLSHINPVAQQPQWFSGDTVPTLSSRSLGFNPRLSKLHANNGLLYYITCIVSCLVGGGIIWALLVVLFLNPDIKHYYQYFQF